MGGYIFIRVKAGFNDSLSILWNFVDYAKRNGRTIIFDMVFYTESALNDIIDFSEFPVPVLCGESHIKNIQFSTIEPTSFGNNPYKESNDRVQQGKYRIPSIGSTISQFDRTKTYDDNVLLMFHGHGNLGGSLHVLENIKFKPAFIKKFNEQRRKFSTFNSIHLRATDYPGYNESKYIKNVDQFVQKYPNTPIYIACDSSELLEKLSSKHSIVVKPLSYKKIDTSYHSLHVSFGKTDPECLSNAIIDLMMCASSSIFLKSHGGFSELIGEIRNTPRLINKLLDCDKL